jgi:hypothetical protein
MTVNFWGLRTAPSIVAVTCGLGQRIVHREVRSMWPASRPNSAFFGSVL